MKKVSAQTGAGPSNVMYTVCRRFRLRWGENDPEDVFVRVEVFLSCVRRSSLALCRWAGLARDIAWFWVFALPLVVVVVTLVVVTFVVVVVVVVTLVTTDMLLLLVVVLLSLLLLLLLCALDTCGRDIDATKDTGDPDPVARVPVVVDTVAGSVGVANGMPIFAWTHRAWRGAPSRSAAS